jgi:hypothetical protein
MQILEEIAPFTPKLPPFRAQNLHNAAPLLPILGADWIFLS